MDQPTVPFDLYRMFLGDDPPLFYLEIVVRCLVIYAWTLILLRWIGGRSVAQLSLVEFLLVIALGSAVGDALFYPEVPLGQAMLAILVVVLIDKLIDLAILRWDLAKRIVDGGPVELIRDGRILRAAIGRRTIGQAELTSALRAAGIRNLGEIDRVWLEPGGKLAIFRRQQPQSGLRIAPPHELAPLPEADLSQAGAELSCAGCGLVLARQVLPPDLHCPACDAALWTRAEPAD